MCDYSLHNVKSRPAKVGDKLTNLVDAFGDWVTDEGMRRKIMLDNPAAFYRF